MIYRAKAPLRLGLAGGGTDVSPYSDTYGGAILNATINLYAYATLIPRDDGKIILHAMDRNERIELDWNKELQTDGMLDLLKGVYNRIVKQFKIRKKLSFELSTFVEAPAGSGLGSSSTLVVAIVGVFVEWLKLPLGEYDIAKLAFDIEREDLGMAGGKQDQYAATFGGFNFMEFYGDKVIVNPLRIRYSYIDELDFNVVLYNTGTSRLSSKIIEVQQKNVVNKNEKSIEAMHGLKEQAIRMKEAILQGELNKFGEILNFGWEFKKQMAEGITNPVINEIYETALKAGATGGKISGAGGGGFMMFYCPENSRFKVMESLKEFGGKFVKFQFNKTGMISWSQKS